MKRGHEMKRGEGFYEIIQKMGEESRKLKGEFNEKYPPHKEILMLDSASLESITTGIWYNEDGSATFSYNLPNGQYDPHRIIHIPKEIANEIRRS